MRKLIVFVVICAVVFFLGRDLNLFEPRMFEFHDETQPARIQQFVLNLKQLQIPPRIAPDFSFKLGYPVFNFYAPASYWISGVFHILGLDIVNTIKISFLLALVTAFIASFFLFRSFFSFFPSLVASIFYVTTLYFAIDIFIRGNLAETWFLSFFPASLYVLKKNAEKLNLFAFIIGTFILSGLLTMHNLLSFISIPILILYIFLFPHKKRNFFMLTLAFLLGFYYFLPLFFESHLTYASEVARGTNYNDHFLCPFQLWESPKWEFGGSISGCNDGMPFKIGKIHVIMFTLGILVFMYQTIISKKTKNILIPLFFLLVMVMSLYLTTYQSRFIWDYTAFISALIQFPWRFIAFALPGIGFFSGYFWNTIQIPFKNIIIFFFILFVLYINKNYFYREPLKANEFQHRYLSEKYIEQTVAYKISEYLPKTANYQFWQRFNNTNPQMDKKLLFDYHLPAESQNKIAFQIQKNSSFEKIIKIPGKDSLKINIHYFPVWQIFINGKQLIPYRFDQLGRPILLIKSPSTIQIIYRQTIIEKMGNIITLITALFIILLLHPFVWKKMEKIIS
jgi:hypothetical protein